LDDGKREQVGVRRQGGEECRGVGREVGVLTVDQVGRELLDLFLE